MYQEKNKIECIKQYVMLLLHLAHNVIVCSINNLINYSILYHNNSFSHKSHKMVWD